MDYNDGAGTLVSNGSMPGDDSTWYHVAITYDDGLDATTIYLDGSADASGSQGPFTGSSTDVRMAARDSGEDLDNDTAFDDFRIYARALSGSEIRKLYELGN